MSHVESAAPVEKKILTPGVFVLLTFITIGLVFAVIRFLFGISAISNLSNSYPWGIWIGIDVATGVALAAGGFTTAALAYVFHQEHFHPIVRPALLTALLGYTFVALGLMVDLGRYYNIWHPMMPYMWSGHSVLFEVGMCVMAYLTVLYVEFFPIVIERFQGKVHLPGFLSGLNGLVEWILGIADKILDRCLFLFIIAGVVLSCMHQSSLGTLMVLAPSKMHPLWYTPILPWLFLLSAFSVGFPMVIFESMWASKSFNRPAEMHILTPLAKYIPPLLFVYAAFKFGDLAIRNQLSLLVEGSLQTKMFWIEVGGGVILPCVMLLTKTVRKSPGLLFLSSTLVILGVAINRINVFLVAYKPVNPEASYFPSIGEIAITAGLICTLVLVYRLAVTIFPILPEHRNSSCAS